MRRRLVLAGVVAWLVVLSGASGVEAAPSIWDPHRARAEAGAELPISDVVGGAVTVGPAGSFQTVSAAVNWAKNDPGVGFTISIQAGVYREKLPEIDERMIIRAAPGASVTISGATLYAKTAWSAPNGSGVRSLVVTEMSQPPGAPGGPGAGPNPPVYPAIPYPQDQAVTSPAVALVEQLFWVNAAGVPSPLTQVVFTGPGQTPGVDQFYYNPYDDKIYALFSTGTWNNAAGFEVASRDTAVRITGNADDSKLIGIEFSYFSPPLLAPTVANPDPTNDSHWGDGRAVIELAGVSSNYLTGVELRDVRVLNSATTAINIDRSTGTTLTRVTNQWNGARGLNANRSDGLRIEYSRFDNNNYLGFDNTGSCGNCRMAGVKITRSGRADDGEPGGGNGPGSVVVRYSSFNANNAQGLWCDLDCANGVIVGNWAGGNTGTGIYWEVSKDATISSNLLVGNGTGVKTSGSQNVAITHNTFYNNTNQLRIGADYRPGTISFHTTAAAHMANIDVQANLFAEPATATSGDRFVVDPENFNTPLPSIRLDQYNRNTYALTSNSTTTGPVRFRTDTDSPRRTPDEFVAVAGGLPHQVWTATNPATVFTNQAAGDYRIASAGNPIYPWDPGVNMPAAAQAQLQGPFPARAGAVFHTGP